MRSVAIDIGNTGTKYGVFEEDALVAQGYFDGQENLPEALLNQAFDHAIVASVAQSAQDIQQRLSVTGKFVELTAQTALPVSNLYKTPQTLGADRIAAAAGANYFFPNRNCLVFDAGTSITHEYIDSIQAYTEKAADLVVILCGGDAGFFESHLKGRIFVIPELVLIGLHRILIHNV